MGLFDFLRSEAHAMKDKIIFTQKQRIVKLEEELSKLNAKLDDKHDEISKVRETHDAAKERLVEQIVDLSDKFAANHSQVISLADDNARMKVLLERKSKEQKKLPAPKASRKKSVKKK